MAYTPQRIVSLQPSVTSTLDRLGLLDRVVACTKWCVDVCPSLAAGGKAIIADSWSANSTEVLAAKPDLVVASVPYQLGAVAEILKAGVPILGFAPRSLYDVYGDIARLAAIMGVAERGEQLIAEMQEQVEQARAKTQLALGSGVHRPRAYSEEWGKPLIRSQGWVAELVEAAGGEFMGKPGEHANAGTIRAEDPEVIVAAWCGAGNRVPLAKIVETRGWNETSAVRNARVYCINDEFLNTPGPTLISGLRALSAAIHPDLFPSAPGLRRIRSDSEKK